MSLQVPFISKELMEHRAEALLARFAAERNIEMTAPIPIEDIMEKLLKFRVEFDDLHRLLRIPRSGGESFLLGAVWLETNEIVIDESLDPEEHPSRKTRYRHTLTHEGCHGLLHRHLVSANNDAKPFVFNSRLLSSSAPKEPVEWQADFLAACVLMPRSLIFNAWQQEFGGYAPLTYKKMDPSSSQYRIAERFAPAFGVSTQSMRIRLKGLGLLSRESPPRESRLWTSRFMEM